MDHSFGQQAAKFLAHLDGDREQFLREHLLGVSLAARRHSDKIGLGPAGAMIGLLHDLGKYSTAFQQYLRRVALTEDTEQPDSERGKIDHSTAGAQRIWQSLKPRRGPEGVAGEILAICVASHQLSNPRSEASRRALISFSKSRKLIGAPECRLRLTNWPRGKPFDQNPVSAFYQAPSAVHDADRMSQGAMPIDPLQRRESVF
jgi:CRISPR-associated endonuclease Cas3-HD